MTVTNLQNYLYENIPISLAMEVDVHEATIDKVTLGAKIAPNINHKRTVFGGSLHSVATLSCWSLIFINLKQLGILAEIVISKSNVKYLAPVTTDFTATCEMNNKDDFARFANMLLKKGKARIKLSASIYQGNQLAVEYEGEFVGIGIKE